MPDMETVIKSLKWFRDRDKWREGIMIHDDHAEVRKQICDNAIELLKEQWKEYYHLRNMLCDTQNELNNQPQIVRCKDCKYSLSNSHFCAYPHKINNIQPGDWYCADGVKKDA